MIAQQIAAGLFTKAAHTQNKQGCFNPADPLAV